MHEPTKDCVAVHCYSCGVDERVENAYIYCYECGHVYRTAGALRRAYRREYWRMSGVFDPVPVWRRVWRVLTVRVKDIFFCQECIHDF